MAQPHELEGFVVVQPGAPATFLHSTFARTATEAWRRFLGGNHEPREYPILRQGLVGKGYRVAQAKLSVTVEGQD